MGINQIQDEIIEDFDFYEDWMEKYEFIIDLGKELPSLEVDKKTEENRIKGCQSQLWIHMEKKEDKLFFEADSDAIITKGIAALLIRPLQGQAVKEIANTDLYFVDKIGLKEHLSMTRANGLVSMMNRIKEFAQKNQ
jgi:cysteine desulfuration protein SufE